MGKYCKLFETQAEFQNYMQNPDESTFLVMCEDTGEVATRDGIIERKRNELVELGFSGFTKLIVPTTPSFYTHFGQAIGQLITTATTYAPIFNAVGTMIPAQLRNKQFYSTGGITTSVGVNGVQGYYPIMADTPLVTGTTQTQLRTVNPIKFMGNQLLSSISASEYKICYFGNDTNGESKLIDASTFESLGLLITGTALYFGGEQINILLY